MSFGRTRSGRRRERCGRREDDPRRTSRGSRAGKAARCRPGSRFLRREGDARARAGRSGRLVGVLALGERRFRLGQRHGGRIEIEMRKGRWRFRGAVIAFCGSARSSSGTSTAKGAAAQLAAWAGVIEARAGAAARAVVAASRNRGAATASTERERGLRTQRGSATAYRVPFQTQRRARSPNRKALPRRASPGGSNRMGSGDRSSSKPSMIEAPSSGAIVSWRRGRCRLSGSFRELGDAGRIARRGCCFCACRHEHSGEASCLFHVVAAVLQRFHGPSRRRASSTL